MYKRQGLTTTGGKVDGVTAQDALGGASFTLRARCVINATGVWVDSVRRMEDKNAPTMVAPSQGVHLTLPHDLSLIHIFAQAVDQLVRAGARELAGVGGQLHPVAFGQERHGIAKVLGYIHDVAARADLETVDAITGRRAGRRPGLVRQRGQGAAHHQDLGRGVGDEPLALVLRRAGGRFGRRRDRDRGLQELPVARSMCIRDRRYAGRFPVTAA